LSALLLHIQSLKICKGQKQLASLPQLFIEQGKAYGMIGESGSGKSLSLLSIAGLLPKGLAVTGKLEWNAAHVPINLMDLTETSTRKMLGKDIGMVFQEPMSALNPQRTCGWQLMESLQIHAGKTGQEARKQQCLQALESTGTIMQSLLQACKKNNSSLLVVSHDIHLLGQFCEHITVMKKGETVVSGPTEQVLGGKNLHPYVQSLLNAVPEGAKNAETTGNAMLKASQLSKTYKSDGQLHKALQNVEFELAKGETLAVIGFSGSGKSTLAKILTGLERADSGSLLFNGQNILYKRPTGIQMVFQDPYASLNASMSNAEIVTEVLKLKGLGRPEALQRCKELFVLTGLDTGLMHEYPTSLSGGQRQRLCIGRALASKPEVLILDEAIAALDPIVQRQILDLLLDIQIQTGIIYIFITHSPLAAKYMSSQVLSLKDGQIEFYGRAAKWFSYSGGA
jgi:peptide/nickel transport system ATP-binding protein